ncbi:hypothetical protein [Streptomyces sp. enrichment culture]|uniref:hypothetical protein n=1 Tax=Streptomyces sp. enrichment culture TaxID=1795815 RepID=UPI003F5550F8
MTATAVTHLDFRGDARDPRTFHRPVFGGDPAPVPSGLRPPGAAWAPPCDVPRDRSGTARDLDGVSGDHA